MLDLHTGLRDYIYAIAWRQCCVRVRALHDSFKSPLAFRKPATAVASRRPARADGPWRSASMGMQASVPAELRGAMGRRSYLSARGRTAKFVVDAGRTMLYGPQ